MRFNVALNLAEFDELCKLIDGESDDYDEELLSGIKERLDRVSSKVRRSLNATETA